MSESDSEIFESPVKKVEEKVVAMDSKNRLVGKLENYILGESFDDYLTLANNFFDLNLLMDDKLKVRLLVNQVGSTASTKILKAIKPTKLEDLDFATLIKTLRDKVAEFAGSLRF